jgi:hypothetical protein
MPATLSRGCVLHSNHLRSTLILLLTLVVIDPVWAQDHLNGTYQKKHLGPCLRLGIASYREDLIVPLVFHGPGLSLGAVFTRNSQKHLVHIQLILGLGHLENRYSHEAWVVSADCRLSWLKRFVGHQRYGEFWGGICTPLRMNNLFFESWDDAHLYWLTAYTAGTAFLWEKTVSPKHSVHVRMEIPLLGWISRPPTYRYTKQDPLNHWTYHFSEPNGALHFETVDTYRSLYLQIVLAREAGRSVWNVGYEFEYDHCAQPKDVWGMNNSVFVSYLWGVGR